MLVMSSAEVGKLRIGELIEFTTTILDLFKRVDPKQKLLVSRIKELNEALTPLDKGFTEKKGESLQAEMRPQDKLRMAALRGLKRSIQAESFREDTTIQQQASMLLKSFSLFCAELNRLSLPHKTLLIRKMLLEWANNAEYTAAIQNLGVERWVTDLTLKNNVFYEDHLDKARNSVPVEKSKKLKAGLIKVYREMVKDVESIARVDGEDPVIQSLIGELNGIIDSYNEPVINRSGRKKRDVVEESPPPPALPVLIEAPMDF